MAGRVENNLSPRRKLVVSLAKLLPVTTVVFGLLRAPQSGAQSQTQEPAAASLVYDVASIKRNTAGDEKQRISFPLDGFNATNVTVQMLIRVAYGVEDNQISGAPNWVNSENYNVEAKMDGATVDALRKLSEDQRKRERERMLQVVLADRLHLTFHRETKELPVYALVIAKNGVKLHKSKPGDTYPNGLKGPDGLPGGPTSMRIKPGEVIIQARPVESLAWALSRLLGRTVLDKSGLEGNYDITLRGTPDEGQGGMLKGPEGSQQGADSAPLPESSGPSIFAALQEQLGLKMESQKSPREILVIDHIDKPSEN
jgi:uncharacterized protein (TIGR03435 family)